MNKTFYPGKHLHSENNVVKKIVKFQKLRTMYQTGEIEKPVYQGALEEERVDQMIESYLKHPEYFQYKNTIILADVNKQLYIIDGQHRIQMVIELCKKHQLYRKTLIIAYYKFNNKTEAESLFHEINIDSKKNQNYIESSSFDKITINCFKDLLNDNYKKQFSKKKTKVGKIKCIEEFVEELNNINFFNNKKAIEAYNIIIQLNYKYYNSLYKKYEEDNSLSTLVYVEELKKFKRKIVFTTKQNNFIEYVKSNGNIKPIHIWKKGKKRITQKLKKKIWFKEFGNQHIAKCPISYCNINLTNNKKLINNITQMFDAGHIISEFNGGTLELNNLRPICKSCNSSMGSTNWNDFDKDIQNDIIIVD